MSTSHSSTDGREGQRVDHLLDERGERLRLVGARLGDDGAELGDDVARRPAGDQPDVRGRLVVEPAQAQIGDGACRSRDGRASVLGAHPRMRGASAEDRVDRSGVRRRADDLAQRPRVVVAVADRRLDRVEVELVGALEPGLLLGREDELDAGVRDALVQDPLRRDEHRRHRGLVVAAEDRVAGVAHDAVLDDGLDRVGRRHGVEVRAEEDRGAWRGRLKPRDDVPGVPADPRAGVVLGEVEAQVAQLAGDSLGHRALVTRRARDRAEFEEEIEDRGHGWRL